MSNQRFRATLEAREKHRQILVDALDSHCARERRKHLYYRIFLFGMIGLVGYWWLDRLPSLPKIPQGPVQKIQLLLQSGKLMQEVELEIGKSQVIGAQNPAAPQALERYRQILDTSALPPELNKNRSPKPAGLYAMPNPWQQSQLQQASRKLASLPSYREPVKSEEARLPNVKRVGPISSSRYAWVGGAAPLRLVPDSAEFPDLFSGLNN